MIPNFDTSTHMLYNRIFNLKIFLFYPDEGKTTYCFWPNKKLGLSMPK